MTELERKQLFDMIAEERKEIAYYEDKMDLARTAMEIYNFKYLISQHQANIRRLESRLGE